MVALMAGEIDNISMLLGQIQGTLNALERKVVNDNSRAETVSAKILSTLDEQDTRLDDLAEATRLMRDQLAAVTITAADSKTVTDDVKRWRQLGIGIIGIVGVGAAWVGANISWLFDVTIGALKAKLGL